MNSVRPWRTSGRPGRHADRPRDQAPPGRAWRVPDRRRHHQLVGSPWRAKKKPVARRNHVLAALVEAGAELILGGHIHQGAVSERREFEVLEGGGAACRLDRARARPAAAHPARRGARPPRLRGLARTTITFETYFWRATAGGSPPCGASRAAASPSTSSLCPRESSPAPRREAEKRPTNQTRMIATTTPTMNYQPAVREDQPGHDQRGDTDQDRQDQPHRVAPGSNSRPSAPTIAPTTMSHTQCTAGRLPRSD